MVEVCRTGAGVQQAHLQDLLVTAGCRCTSAGTKTGDTPTDNGLQHVVFCWGLGDFFPQIASFMVYQCFHLYEEE